MKERENEAESEMKKKTGGVNCDRIPEMTVLKIGNENSITHMHSGLCGFKGSVKVQIYISIRPLDSMSL